MIRHIFSGLITAISLTFYCSFASAQNDTGFIKHASASLEKHASDRPIEKVYLHLDKSNYDLGDTIWYKAYTVIGPSHQLSVLSGVLYVELIGPADTVMVRHILHLTAGVAWGGLPLPDKARPGNYHIRAYTKWMRNEDAAYFYNQEVRIGGYENVPPVRKVVSNPDVQFFPEGGWLVNDLRSKVAIKAVNANGLGQNIKGEIEDNEGNVIVDFETRHLGMGAFAFEPQIGKSYRAKITTAESSYIVPLPAAKLKGYTLSINNADADSIFIKVAANETLFNEQQHHSFYITAQISGKVYYAAAGKLEDKVFTASVDKKRFPSGIAQFTLFSEQGEPLNERIVFIQNNDTLKLHVAARPISAVRGQVKVDFVAGNENQQGVAGTFSVAVINESIVNNAEANEGTILNRLLLTSDLKGYIEQPNYYFIDRSAETKADLDILMLTQGYRRYDWKPILNDTLPGITYQPEDALSLSGTIKTFSGKPVPNGKVTLVAIHDKLLADTVADANGNFKFTDLELPDSAKLVLSAKKSNNSNSLELAVSQPVYPGIAKKPHAGRDNMPDLQATAVTTATTDSAAFQKQNAEFLKRKRQLHEVVIKARRVVKREPPDLENSANMNGAGNADQVIMSKDLVGCVNLAECLMGLMRGVSWRREGVAGKVDVPYNNRTHGMHAPGKMVIFIDGAPQAVNLEDIDPKIIHSIEVLESAAYMMVYGYDMGGGVILITTKHSGDKDYFMSVPAQPGTIKYIFNGYYKAKEFYSPRYDGPQNNAAIPDLRSTIYWNPNIITDKDGKASIDYFNADGKGIYRIVVEGIDSDGNLGRVVYRYRVE